MGEQLLNHRFLSRSIFVQTVLPVSTLCALVAAHGIVFLATPIERVMGAVQKIFYFHVGAALAAYLMVFFLFAGSCGYLRSKRPAWDLFAEASAKVALLFCTVVLATGMIWGHAAWNVWWRWEPRLVSFLVLWLVLLSYVLLRTFAEDHERGRNFAAVLGIVAALNVPLVVISVKLMDQASQLHPQVIEGGGVKDPRFLWALGAGVVAVVLLALWLFFMELSQQALGTAVRDCERNEHMNGRG